MAAASRHASLCVDNTAANNLVWLSMHWKQIILAVWWSAQGLFHRRWRCRLMSVLVWRVCCKWSNVTRQTLGHRSPWQWAVDEVFSMSCYRQLLSISSTATTMNAGVKFSGSRDKCHFKDMTHPVKDITHPSRDTTPEIITMSVKELQCEQVRGTHVHIQHTP